MDGDNLNRGEAKGPENKEVHIFRQMPPRVWLKGEQALSVGGQEGEGTGLTKKKKLNHALRIKKKRLLAGRRGVHGKIRGWVGGWQRENVQISYGKQM